MTRITQHEQLAADAMAAKRRALMAQPLDRIWPELARAAISALPGGEGNPAPEARMPTGRPVAFRVPRVVDDKISKTEFMLFIDEDEARMAACGIGADYDGLYLVADRRAAFIAQPDPAKAAPPPPSAANTAATPTPPVAEAGVREGFISFVASLRQNEIDLEVREEILKRFAALTSPSNGEGKTS